MGRWQERESDWPSQNSFCVKIHVYDQQKDLLVSKRSVRGLVNAVLEKEHYLEVSIYLVPERKICHLHEKFFDDPSPTDCISFPIDDEYLGEIFVCPKAALKYDHHRPYEELSLYVIHGILHCLGFDDLEPKTRRVMRKKEKMCMALIKDRKLILGP